MRIATIYYDENRDQTTVKYSDGFMASGWVLRADVLKDLYGTIDTDYNKLFEEKPKKGEF
jgi:hypothetical protein